MCVQTMVVVGSRYTINICVVGDSYRGGQLQVFYTDSVRSTLLLNELSHMTQSFI